MTKISIVFKCLRNQKLLKNVFKMKNLRKISRSQLNKIVGADRFDLCSSIVEHDGSAGNRCDCDLHCNSRKCSLGKCL